MNMCGSLLLAFPAVPAGPLLLLPTTPSLPPIKPPPPIPLPLPLPLRVGAGDAEGVEVFGGSQVSFVAAGAFVVVMCGCECEYGCA